ncbi:MAG: HD domain-containing protein [Firmicutes bacterium]|nr:HD domain-containing protein [Bacillota bacterium]
MGIITLEDIKRDREVDTFITRGNEFLGKMGFTEHGYRHVNLVAERGYQILTELKHSRREAELVAIAGYLHDIGNVVNREGHSQSGALLAFSILTRLGMPLPEVATVTAAIGNHDEQSGQAVNNVAAALILADKSDVHRSRVRNQEVTTFDIHDRVNYAVIESQLRVDEKKRTITMELTIEIQICPVMEYFEIFLTRMIMCRRAANFLGCRFGLIINDAQLL